MQRTVSFVLPCKHLTPYLGFAGARLHSLIDDSFRRRIDRDDLTMTYEPELDKIMKSSMRLSSLAIQSESFGEEDRDMLAFFES